MLLRLSKVLNEDTLKTLRTMAEDPEAFEEGTKTAGWSARMVKNNRQLKPGARQATVAKCVEQALRDNTVFMAAARPKRFCRIMLSRYEPGMAYGTHIDDPIIDHTRTDLSFTLFLSDPADYEGGALIIEGSDRHTAIRLDAGDMILYPTTALHRVDEVKRGVRLACVGWVRSMIRLEAHREILFDLDMASRAIFDKDGKSPVFDRLAKVRSNLTRLWAED